MHILLGIGIKRAVFFVYKQTKNLELGNYASNSKPPIIFENLENSGSTAAFRPENQKSRGTILKKIL